MANLFKWEAGKYNALMGLFAERLTPEEGERLLADARDKNRPPGVASDIDRMIAALRGHNTPAALPPGHYRMTVTKRPLPTKRELFGSKAFDWVADLFDGRTWTDGYVLDGHEVVVTPEYGPTEFLLKGFRTRMTSEQVIRWAEANGWRVATALETIDFVLANLQVAQLDGPIVALGSFAMDVGYRCVAVLGRNGAGRGLDDGWFVGVWLSGCRFLLVRKSPSR